MKQNGEMVNRRGAERLLWELSKFGRVRFWYLATKMNVKVLTSIFVLVACSVSMVIMGVAAYLTSWPFIFLSLGPSTFLCFYSPSSPMSAPRNMVLGHGIGAVVGFGVYQLLRVLIPPSMSGSMWLFIAPAISLGVVGMVMIATDVLHPPAGSTTMIAAMGLMPDWYSILVVMGAVALIALQAYLMHTLAGIKYPFWQPAEKDVPMITTLLGDVVFDHQQSGKAEDPFAAVSSQLASRRKVSPKGKNPRS